MLLAYNERLYEPLSPEQKAICSALLSGLNNQIYSKQINRAGVSAEEFLFFLSQKNYMFHGSSVDLGPGEMLLPQSHRSEAPRICVTPFPPVAMGHALFQRNKDLRFWYPDNIFALSDFYFYLVEQTERRAKYKINNPGFVYVLENTESLRASPFFRWEGLYTEPVQPVFRIAIKLKDFFYRAAEYDAFSGYPRHIIRRLPLY